MINTGNCRSEVGAKSGKSMKAGKWQKHMASLNDRHLLGRKKILAKAAQLRAQINRFIFSKLSAESSKQTAMEDQEGLLHALLMLLNRLGHSLAGLVGALTAVCCGKTALSGEESSPGGRLSMHRSAKTDVCSRAGISVWAGSCFKAINVKIYNTFKVVADNANMAMGIAAVVAGLYAAIAPYQANADPIMSIDYNSQIADYDVNPENGLEKK